MGTDLVGLVNGLDPLLVGRHEAMPGLEAVLDLGVVDQEQQRVLPTRTPAVSALRAGERHASGGRCGALPARAGKEESNRMDV